MTHDLEAFLEADVERVDVGTPLCFRRFGEGPPVVLVHGWPLNGATYRAIVRRLSRAYACYVPDLPGAGATPWDPRTRNSFQDFGDLIVKFIDALGLEKVALIGHDSGGAIARVAAAQLGERVRLLVLIDTEVPHHTPGLVKLYGAVARLPGAAAISRGLMSMRWYRRSRLGFGACFSDPAHIDGEFHRACVARVLENPEGPTLTLAHLDYAFSEQLPEVHRRISAPVVLIWGDQDRFFPIALAREMQSEFPRCVAFHELPGQSLFVHDERPDLVAPLLLSHLSRYCGAESATAAHGTA